MFPLWALLTILSALFYAVTNIIDKFSVTKLFRKHFTPMAFFVVVSFIVGVALLPFSGYQELSPQIIGLSVLVGTLVVFAVLLYFKAAQMEEISTVMAVWYIEPIYVVFLAYLFLGESFGALKYVGIVLIVVGAVLLQMRVSKVRFGGAFWLMLLAGVVEAVEVVILKYVLGFSSFMTVFSLSRIGILLGGIPLLIFGISDIRRAVARVGKRAILIPSTSEALNLIAPLLFLAAASSGYITLVTALAGIQPLFVVVIAAALAYFYPKVMEERVNREILMIRLASICLIIIGAAVVVS